jgi:HPt (histidine-containing phosphotransfer) domain-containing protein
VNAQSIIDLPTFEELKENMGADFMVELAQAYFDETPQLLSRLQDALARKDCEAFRQAAHSIKSTSNSFGALEFGALAKDLEIIGREACLDGAEEKVDKLVKEYSFVEQTIKELSHGK